MTNFLLPLFYCSSVLFLVLAVYIRKVESNTALLIIDVQNCFLPGGSLAVAGGQKVIPVINSIRKNYGRDFTLTVLSQDWHCADHVSFASQHDGKSAYESVELQYDNEGNLCNSSCDATYNVTQTLWPDHCVKGTHGANFSTLLNTSDVDFIIKKGFKCHRRNKLNVLEGASIGERVKALYGIKKRNQHVDSYSAFYDNGGFAQTRLDSILKMHNIDTVVVTGLALDYCVYYTSKDAEKLGYTVYTVLDASRPVSNVTMETALRDLRQRGVNLIQSSDIGNIMTSAGVMTSSVAISSILTSLMSYYVLIRFMHH